MLEHAGPDAMLDILCVARLEDHRLDALQVKQMGEQQAGRAGADDAHLSSHATDRTSYERWFARRTRRIGGRRPIRESALPQRFLVIMKLVERHADDTPRRPSLTS